jgi:Tfp pilus tip-associated adhesin PilY1
MQYFCQTNVALLSTDGYWNNEAGFTLAGLAVGDQDGDEVRPMFDGGVESRQKRVYQNVKQLEPTAATWTQEKTQQDWFWKEQYELQIGTPPQKTTGKLWTRAARWDITLWTLYRRDYIQGDKVLSGYESSVKALNKLEGSWVKTTYQLQEVHGGGSSLKQTGHLQRRPTSLYNKRAWTLHQRITMARMQKHTGLIWSAYTDVEECTTKGNIGSGSAGDIRCSMNAPKAWEAVSSCTTQEGGQLNTGNLFDGSKAVFRKKVECEYRYSPTEADPPVEKNLENCTSHYAAPSSQNDATGNHLVYSDPTMVECAEASLGEDAWKDVDSCTTSSQYECRYNWDAGVNVTSCVSNYSVNSPYTIANGVKCNTDALSKWVDVAPGGTCVKKTGLPESDPNYTDCRYRVVTRETGGAACTATDKRSAGTVDGSVYDVVTPTECVQEWNTTWQKGVSKCIPSETGTLVKCEYDAEWSNPPEYYTIAQGCAQRDMTPVTENGQLVYYPARACGRLYEGYDPDIKKWEDIWTATSGCTPKGTGASFMDASPNPQVGDRRCMYASQSSLAQPSCPGRLPPKAGACDIIRQGDPKPLACETSTSEPPVTSFGGSIVDCIPKFYDDDWVPATGPCVVSEGRQCEYRWDDPVELAEDETCVPVHASNAPNYDVLDPVQCSIGASGVEEVDKCPEGSTEKQCWETSEWVKVDNSNHPGYTRESRKPGVQYEERWENEIWTPVEIGQMAATENAAPPTNNLCDPSKSPENLGNGRYRHCQAVVPLKSETFYARQCVDEGASAANGFVITHCLVEQNLTADAECGRQENGELLDGPFPGSAPDWKHVECLVAAGVATPDTLADVAEYYWETDLRSEELDSSKCWGSPIGSEPALNVCDNNIPEKRQLMNTYTLGFGASGHMQYQANYKGATVGDFYSVKAGLKAAPDKGVCTWQKEGTVCNWPKPSSGRQTNIDDLWHAALNGRGDYYSAGDPAAMAAGISTALQQVTAKEGSLASVTISNPRFPEVEAAVGISAFQVSFASGTWTGEVQQFQITESPEGLVKKPGWSARSLLDIKPYATRDIHLFDPDATGRLKPFTFNDLTNAEKIYFMKPYIAGLSQLCGSGATCLPETDHAAVQGENLVNFLRGERTYEGAGNDVSKFYRQRASVLGDIVGSEATYVQKSTWSYADNGYSNFKKGNANRTAMIYVGANDGMLHAFNATTGQETWAYVPRFLLPRLYLLADKNYSIRHRYFVDGTPVMGDVCVSNCGPGDTNPVWKTILVGGANLGGRGYYALDITDPANPKGLWEFTSANDANLGYTFGNPVITKLSNGTWVVLVTSGYNNISPGDGKGRLFVLNAETGAPVSEIPAGLATSAGSEASPSGLAKISAWTDYPDYNNTAKRVYGGDLLGNLWRFDINGTIPPSGREAIALATLTDGSGNAQPITTQPELGMILNRYPIVFVGTGQLLGMTDTLSTGVQSLYAIKDTLWSSGYGSPRGSDMFVKQIMTSETCPSDNTHCITGQSIVTVSKNEVDWKVKNGWYVDLPRAGERINTDIMLSRGTLTFVTNLPQTGACVPAGKSFLYMLDYQTGGFVGETDTIGGIEWADQLSTSPTIYEDSGGGLGGLVQGDGAGAGFLGDTPIKTESRGARERRISWRVLIVE